MTASEESPKIAPPSEESKARAAKIYQQTLNDRYTNGVITSISADASPRVKEIIISLIQHLHAFAREVELTTPEWLVGVDHIARAGQMTDDRRNESVLLSDVTGLSSLVDQITQDKLRDAAHTEATLSAILGPFWREGAPRYPHGADIVQKHGADEETAFIEGRVTDALTGEPVVGATVDVWLTAPNGLYEQQDPEQPEYNLRGKFTTDESGYYSFYGLRPTSYPIPYDGPAGDILKAIGRHPMRPGHIHWIVRAEGYAELTTQLYDRRDKYVEDDSVFAVKDSLVVDFLPSKREKADFELVYNIKLAKASEAKA